MGTDQGSATAGEAPRPESHNGQKKKGPKAEGPVASPPGGWENFTGAPVHGPQRPVAPAGPRQMLKGLLNIREASDQELLAAAAWEIERLRRELEQGPAR